MTDKSLILSIDLDEYNKNEELLVEAQKTGNYENVKTEEVKNEVIKENKIGDIKRIEIKPVPATK